MGGCSDGNAKLTKGFLLPAKHVAHAVGPVWQGGKQNEPELLASCYRRALELATLVDAKTIAFPCISTGVYGYPFNQAARIAVAQVQARTSRSLARRSSPGSGLSTTASFLDENSTAGGPLLQPVHSR
jgi:O-acetyl-ADP-ribose deacetylase (regulator of RNase III)